MRSPWLTSLLPSILLAALPAGCGDDDGSMSPADAGPGDGAAADAGPAHTPVCTEPTDPPCVDEQILDLNLFSDPNTAAIDNEADGSGWETHVDATAGGFDPSEGYVYARFTDEGLERLDLSDEAAFDSMDWDVAFRRFIIRLNSGPSGPSCVSGARTGPATDYDALDAPPDGIEYHEEQYYTSSCELVPDGSGLGSPGTVLQSFWEYPGCVQMSGNVYILELASGRHLKLTVTSYYDPAVQETCDTTGMIDMTSPSGSGNIRFRWAFLD